MKVSEAIELLKLLPSDSVLVGTDGPLRRYADKGEYRPGIHTTDAVLAGFSAEEVRAEEFEFFLLEDSGIVVLAMTRNSAGDLV